MSRNRLRVEANERVDLSDFQYLADEGLNTLAEQIPGNFLTDPTGQRAWILDGFAIDNPTGNQVRVTKGRAILSRREGGVVTHGMVTTEGDATKIIDTTSFAAAVHGVYIRFEYVPGTTLGRVFWDASGASEFSQNVETRRLANWSMRIEQTNPGAEWFKIGEVDLSVGPSSITDQRDFYFEGNPDSGIAYESTWGGGLDRDANRAANGIKDLRTFVAAIRQLLQDIRPVGRRWWELGGIRVIGTGTSETGVQGNGGSPDGTGVVGFGFGTGRGVFGNNDGSGSGSGVFGSVSNAGTGSAVKGECFGTGNARGLEGLAKGTSEGVFGQGGATSGVGVSGQGGAPNGRGVLGTSAGTGDAVRGDSSAGTGYGVVAQADATTPVRSALRAVPQDADPSTALAGDAYINTTTGKLAIYDGADWARYSGQVEVEIADITLTNGTPSATLHTIPASTLRAGSIVEIWLGAELTGDGGGANSTFDLRITLFDGTSTLTVVLSPASTPNANENFVLHGFVTARANPGAAVALSGGGQGMRGAIARAESFAPQNLDTTQAITIDADMNFSVAGDIITIRASHVRIS